MSMQGWRTRAEVARELGITDRTLQRHLAKLGIRPSRPGRIAMLSDAGVSNFMEESRWRTPSPKGGPVPRSLNGTPSNDIPGQGAHGTQKLLTEIEDFRRVLDGTC